MNNDLKKITALVCACLVFAGVILLGNSGLTLSGYGGAVPAVASLDVPADTPLQITGDTPPRALVLYSPQRPDSVQYGRDFRCHVSYLSPERRSGRSRLGVFDSGTAAHLLPLRK